MNLFSKDEDCGTDYDSFGEFLTKRDKEHNTLNELQSFGAVLTHKDDSPTNILVSDNKLANNELKQKVKK